ncbi:MAG: DUF3127 domain-containing protein [Candidatus Cyclobacteriaceae bacterium M2_1C_046]
MELSGKVINILPLQTGKSQRGEWRKQDFILETQDQYPKTVCVSLWGDKIDEASLSEGDQINAHINIESREYNGRWYTDVKAWRIDKQGAADQSAGPADYASQETTAPPSAPLPDEEDDLPF